jgi:hypothetical protein
MLEVKLEITLSTGKKIELTQDEIEELKAYYNSNRWQVPNYPYPFISYPSYPYYPIVTYTSGTTSN